jgi:hypothetical protein
MLGSFVFLARKLTSTGPMTWVILIIRHCVCIIVRVMHFQAAKLRPERGFSNPLFWDDPANYFFYHFGAIIREQCVAGARL